MAVVQVGPVHRQAGWAFCSGLEMKGKMKAPFLDKLVTWQVMFLSAGPFWAGGKWVQR